jgi:hypothetical protein
MSRAVYYFGLVAALLTSCKAGQVLTGETVVTDSLRRRQVERLVTVALTSDGQQATVKVTDTHTDQARRETRRETQQPAPRAPWYDRWARWIAGTVLLLVAAMLALRSLTPFRF